MNDERLTFIVVILFILVALAGAIFGLLWSIHQDLEQIVEIMESGRTP